MWGPAQPSPAQSHRSQPLTFPLLKHQVPRLIPGTAAQMLVPEEAWVLHIEGRGCCSLRHRPSAAEAQSGGRFRSSSPTRLPR